MRRTDDVPIGMYALRRCSGHWAYCTGKCAECPALTAGVGTDELPSFQRAVDAAIAESRKNGQPVAMYDGVRKRAYLEYPDGRREYIDAETGGTY